MCVCLNVRVLHAGVVKQKNEICYHPVGKKSCDNHESVKRAVQTTSCEENEGVFRVPSEESHPQRASRTFLSDGNTTPSRSILTSDSLVFFCYTFKKCLVDCYYYRK